MGKLHGLHAGQEAGEPKLTHQKALGFRVGGFLLFSAGLGFLTGYFAGIIGFLAGFWGGVLIGFAVARWDIKTGRLPHLSQQHLYSRDVILFTLAAVVLGGIPPRLFGRRIFDAAYGAVLIGLGTAMVIKGRRGIVPRP